MSYQSNRQKAAHNSRLFSEHMARLRRQAVPVLRINPLTCQPLMEEMAKQAAKKQAELDSMLREGDLS